MVPKDICNALTELDEITLTLSGAPHLLGSNAARQEGDADPVAHFRVLELRLSVSVIKVSLRRWTLNGIKVVENNGNDSVAVSLTSKILLDVSRIGLIIVIIITITFTFAVFNVKFSQSTCICSSILGNNVLLIRTHNQLVVRLAFDVDLKLLVEDGVEQLYHWVKKAHFAVHELNRIQSAF
jgi:hypothetical protein